MGQGWHRIKKRHTTSAKALAKRANTMDHFMYGVALIAPLMTIPQLTDIWLDRNVQGVSILTWGAYAGVSALWMVYGIIHKEKPMVLTQFLLLILDAAIVIGILLYR